MRDCRVSIQIALGIQSSPFVTPEESEFCEAPIGIEALGSLSFQAENWRNHNVVMAMTFRHVSDMESSQ